MKIIMVHNTYREAGGEDVVFENEKRLLQRSGHIVIPYMRSNLELQDTYFLDRIAIATQMIWSSKTRHGFAAILDAERPDIVHVHNTFMAISPSIYSACSARNIPVVQTLHNFRLLCPAGNFFRDGIICNECVTQNLLQSVHHGCYRNSRGATAGVALMLAVHRALNTWRPGEYALFVGRLVENKGLRVLLKAWKELHEQYPLQIVGDGPDRSTLQGEAREWQLSGITFRGRLSREEVIEAVKGARFVIVPSTLYEGLPMCIVESFACGTPVLCSRLGGLAEIVEQHLTGLHFNPGDSLDLAAKVEWAWNHPLELSQMGRAARAKYETDYTAEKNYSLLMEIYEQALSACASRRPLPLLSQPAISNSINQQPNGEVQ